MTATQIAHTPGPWFEGFVMGTDNLAIVGDRDSVVCMFDRGWPVPGSMLRADVQLIAAAPDLLAALKALLAEKAEVPIDAKVYTQVLAAINKAEG
jgi:D-ribose pyranose/furanose isomerase RbsD